MCERAILKGAAGGGVPTEVLYAISLTETGRSLGGKIRPWPWAINREGQGYWFATRDEALAFAKDSLAQGRRSFDVGCFQINYHWHGHNFANLEAMFDQDVGAAYAAKFLRELHSEFGNWTQAAGAYHSRTPEFANRYRARFERILAGVGGSALVVAAFDAEDAEPSGPPRKSRTRMAVKPKVVNLSGTRSPIDPVSKAPKVRIERGRVPPGFMPEGQVSMSISARNGPL